MPDMPARDTPCSSNEISELSLKYQPLHAHHRGRDHDSCQKNPRCYGRKGGPEAKAHQKGNGAAGPGPGHGEGMATKMARAVSPKLSCS